MLFYRPHTLDQISKKALEIGLFSIPCVADVWQNFYKKRGTQWKCPFFGYLLKKELLVA